MKNNRLVLVSANRQTDPYPVYPIGISYLSSFLNVHRPDLEIYLFDFMTSSFEDFIKLLQKTEPGYIGISLRNIDDVNIYRQESFIEHYKKIIGITREFSNSVIILGGAGFSIYPEILYRTLQPDFGISGEGEMSLLRLLNAIESDQDFKNIEGLIFKKGNEVKVNKRTTFNASAQLCYDESLVDFYWKSSGMLNIQTKRGCPYRCIYCTYPLIEGTRVRTLDPQQIIDTLSHLYSEKQIDYVFFTDSIFNISNNFNSELAERLIKSGLKIKWGGYFNFVNIDFELLSKFRQAGLQHIEFGTDSLSDFMLQKYGKPFTFSNILMASEFCDRLGINYAHFLILGGYGETEKTLDETFKNSKRIGKTVFFPFIGMRIYPGTFLHEIAIKENIVKEKDPLLSPVYYISKEINLATLKEKALKSGRRWIFPDENHSEVINRMRDKNKKGPLWEYLAT
ncbi:MAG: lipid biosynthesis B12-binding/radical SAM protein [Bacteroidales bacterium]|jgi:radical SAM superfamily enzyme YgiQ (UPF0313 family)